MPRVLQAMVATLPIGQALIWALIVYRRHWGYPVLIYLYMAGRVFSGIISMCLSLNLPRYR